jgi:hypothetical protein
LWRKVGVNGGLGHPPPMKLRLLVGFREKP